MSQKLPVGGFKWVAQGFTVNDVVNWDKDGDWGCFVECDAHIPEDLHDYLNDMPPFPESVTIDSSMQSAKTREQQEKRFGPDYKDHPQPKLAPNLSPKKKYICHIAALQKWIALGGKVDKIYRVLKFKQSSWLEPYIRFNTQKRMAATSEFKRSFYKLMINSFFGYIFRTFIKIRYLDYIQFNVLIYSQY